MRLSMLLKSRLVTLVVAVTAAILFVNLYTRSETKSQTQKVVNIAMEDVLKGIVLKEEGKVAPVQEVQVQEPVQMEQKEPDNPQRDAVPGKPSQDLIFHLNKPLESPELQQQVRPDLIYHNNATKVVLATYYRGGSTFAGELFNRNPEAFYWFEPLGGLLEYNETRQKLYHFPKEESFSVGVDGYTMTHFPDHLVDKLMLSVAQILNCDFTNMDKDLLRHYFVSEWATSRSFIKYQRCISQNTGSRKRNEILPETIDFCLPTVSATCKSSRIRAIKTIRMGIFEVEKLLKLDPNVFVFHYVRDPRGQLNSKWELFGYSHEEKFIRRVCNKMRDDMQYSHQLRLKYPNNFFILRYEDFVNDTTTIANNLYEIIGQKKAPDEVIDFLYRSTHAVQSNEAMGTMRKDASAIPTKWQKALPEQTKMLFMEYCSDIISMYKYPGL